MAYISKQEVQAKQVKLSALNKEFGVTARFSGSGGSSLTLTVTAGNLDFIEDFIATTKEENNHGRYFDEEQQRKRGNIQVNHYYLDRAFSGKCLAYLEAAYKIMLEGHFDKSDAQVDYFHCSWYNHIQIGKWNKPYQLKTN